jgi:D-alanyl-D-alanine carboxypeptidase (penicillin-binding protein 5/6)
MPQSPDSDVHARKTLPQGLLGAIALFLLCIAAFAFAYAYMENASEAGSAAQAAAAAQRPDPFASITLQAKAVYVLDLTDGTVLYQKDADERLPLASLTKVATALAVSEVLDPRSIITIPYDTAYAGSPPTKLVAGQRLSVSDVMNFTLIASSNEGAQMLADAADAALHQKYPQSPAQGATLWRMNDLARSLGLTQTSFANVSGLDLTLTEAGAYGSARDMARLFAYAASTSPQYFAATAVEDISVQDEAGQTTAAHNTDEALGHIPGLIMGKTGFTDLAGGNLATVFDVGLAHPVVAVVLGSTYDGRFADMKTLVEKSRQAIAR